MPTALQFRRGTTTQNNSFTGVVGELTVDTDLDTIRVHDGSTAGGFALVQAAATQTLTNKTLTSPTINGGTFSGTFTGTISPGQVTTNSIVSNGSNADISIQPSGTGDVLLSALRVNGTTLDSSDSTKITIAENVDVTGTLAVTGALSSATSLALATGATVTGILDEDAMGTNSATQLATQQSIKAYVDAQDAAIASDTLTLTNKTFDVEGTGNSISNIDVADFKAAAIVIESEGIGSNDNDTTLPTSAAVKDYVDTQITAEDLDVTTDSGTIAIELDSETLTFTGGTGIDSSATGNAVTLAIDSTVATLTGSQTLTNKTLTNPILSPTATTGGKVEFLEGTNNGTNKATLIGPASTADVTITLPAATDTLVGKATTDTFTNKSIDFDNNTITNIEVDNLKSGVLDTDISSVAGTDTTLASAKAIKAYVDAQVTLQDLDVQGDSGTIDIDLDSETLDIAGGTNITTAGAGTTLTVNLDTALTGLTSVAVDNITISDNIITTNASNANLELSANGTGVVKIDGGIEIGDANMSFGTATTSSSGAANMDTFTAATFRSAKYQVSIVDSTNTRFGIYEVFVTHDGSSAYINAQGISDTGLDLATFSADIDSGSVRVRVVPISDASTVFKFVRTVFAV